jgi:hypothetical protein
LEVPSVVSASVRQLCSEDHGDNTYLRAERRSNKQKRNPRKNMI